MIGGEHHRWLETVHTVGSFREGEVQAGMWVTMVRGQATGQWDRRQVQSQGAKLALPGGSTVAMLSWGREDKASAPLDQWLSQGCLKGG